MEGSRALLTDGDREIIKGERDDVTDAHRHSTKSRIRRRIREQLPRDLQLLREHQPDIYREALNRVEEEREKHDGRGLVDT